MALTPRTCSTCGVAYQTKTGGSRCFGCRLRWRKARAKAAAKPKAPPKPRKPPRAALPAEDAAERKPEPLRDVGLAQGYRCLEATGPCPEAGCRHHLERGLGCAIREANAGPLTLDEVGALLDLTGERVRQLTDRAVRKLRRRALVLAHLAEDEP